MGVQWESRIGYDDCEPRETAKAEKEEAIMTNTISMNNNMIITGGILLFEYSAFKGQEGAGRIVVIFVYAGALFLAMLGVWLFPLTAKFVYTTAGCFRNACILCISKLFRTAAMVLIMSVIPFILTHDLRLAPLALLIGISLPSYFCALIYHPVFDEMIRKRQKKEGEDIIDEKGEGIDPEKEE